MSAYVSAGADVSGCGQYRYLLWREWRGGYRWRNGEPMSCLFIMLNPSTADAEQDDPTIRRCVGFAKRFGYDRLEVVNLFAFRATDPDVVLSMSGKGDPIGPRNQEVIEQAASAAGTIICAWGAHGRHIGQDEAVRGWLVDRPTYALGLTKAGCPRHPLYIRADANLVRYV